MRTRLLSGGAAALALVSMAGCPVVGDSRLANQGGGSVFSAVTKVAGEQMTALTPDELQIVADAVSDLSPEVDIFLSDEQAQAAVDFLVLNDLNSLADIEALANDPSGVQIPDSLQAIIDSGIDPSTIVTQ